MNDVNVLTSFFFNIVMWSDLYINITIYRKYSEAPCPIRKQRAVLNMQMRYVSLLVLNITGPE